MLEDESISKIVFVRRYHEAIYFEDYLMEIGSADETPTMTVFL